MPKSGWAGRRQVSDLTDPGASCVAHNTAVAQSGGRSEAFPPLNPDTFAPQLVWLAITFGLLYLLLKRTILPRLGNIIAGRQERIRDDLAEAQITARISAVEQRIGEAKAKALVNLEDIAIEVAGTLVAHLIGKEVSKADIERALLRRAAE